jgi:2Fe-2S ferredoxin
MENSITITVIDNGTEHILQTYPDEYRNLMMLLYDRIYLEDFGECRGMGRCGTCLIEVLETKAELTRLDRNENATLKKLNIPNLAVTLACQILIDPALDGSRISIWQN